MNATCAGAVRCGRKNFRRRGRERIDHMRAAIFTILSYCSKAIVQARKRGRENDNFVHSHGYESVIRNFYNRRFFEE